jgi:valyl-tRNA synthetase
VDVGALQPLQIKIIADANVDPAFGTGAVGVTPAHSQIDFEMYEKQKAKEDPIGLIPVIDRFGKMTKNAGSAYEGLAVEEARAKFVAYLRSHGLVEKEEEVVQNVSTSDRFKDIIEVIPMTQWFVAVNKEIPNRGRTLKTLMREAVTTGHGGDAQKTIHIKPDNFRTIYLHWIDNLRDWCVSRQIWWGHRIPMWYCLDCNKNTTGIPTWTDAQGDIQPINPDENFFMDTDAAAFFAAEKPTQCPT